MEKGKKKARRPGAREMKYGEQQEGCRSAATRASLSSLGFMLPTRFARAGAPNCLWKVRSTSVNAWYRSFNQSALYRKWKARKESFLSEDSVSGCFHQPAHTKGTRWRLSDGWVGKRLCWVALHGGRHVSPALVQLSWNSPSRRRLWRHAPILTERVPSPARAPPEIFKGRTQLSSLSRGPVRMKSPLSQPHSLGPSTSLAGRLSGLCTRVLPGWVTRPPARSLLWLGFPPVDQPSAHHMVGP